MTYENIVPGVFLSRPNRFVAYARVDGHMAMAHIKNTGRCKELLLPETPAYLEDHGSSGRKTRYSVISVMKGQTPVNIDSQAPNKVWHEALSSGLTVPGLDIITHVKREAVYGGSRLDFYAEGLVNGEKATAYMEVKGVTLELSGTAMFPDAPTERGQKHVHELIKAAGDGHLAYIVFIIQMMGVAVFKPNDAMDPAFGQGLRQAAGAGVRVLAYDCAVTPNTITLGEPVPVVM